LFSKVSRRVIEVEKKGFGIQCFPLQAHCV
jgi:hypothetical protein